MSNTLKIILLLLGIIAFIGCIFWWIKEKGWEPKVATIGAFSTVIVLIFNLSQNGESSGKIDIANNKNSPVANNIENQNNYYMRGDTSDGIYSGGKDDKEGFRIVEFLNKFDLFTITLLNNTNNSQYIKEVILRIKKRYLMKHQIIPMRTHPHDNEIMLVNIVLNKNEYRFKPKIYIEPKQAENLNFRLHRPHEHNNFEFIEIEFEIITQNNQVIKTDPIIDLIGHINLLLIDTKDAEPSYSEVIEFNKSIIEKIKNSSLEKSQRAIDFINIYENSYHKN